MLNSTDQKGLSALNPLTKLGIITCLTVCIFLTNQLEWLGLLLLYVLTGFLVSKVRLGILKWMLVPFIISVPTSIFIFIASYWVETGSLAAGLEKGLYEGSLFLLRILILLLANILFVRTTDVRQLTSVLTALKFPETAVLLITSVFRFIPLMLEEGQRILDVQRTRGIKPLHLLLPNRFLPLVVPLLVINMQRSYEMSLSMQLRGGLQKEKNAAHTFSFSDIVAILSMIILTLLLV